MQVNPQPSVRPVPARRRAGDKLNSRTVTANFENQVQDSNANLERKKGKKSTRKEHGKSLQKETASGSIDIKA